MQFFNDIHIYISFSSRPTDPKFLTGQPEKQQINLEWPKLLYKKLESSLLDYLALSLVSYTLGLIGDRGIARACSSLNYCTRN